MIVKATETTGSYNRRVRFPRKRCTCRITEEEFGASRNSGNLMVTRKLEIVLPEVLTVDGQNYEIAGQEITQYRVVRNIDPVTKERDPEKSSRSISNFLEERKNLGLPADELDDENPPLDLKGMLVDAIISSDESELREDPTDEQKEAKELGSPVLGQDGKPIKTYRLKVESILGRSTADVNKPYA